jgi:DNA polymerase-1
MSRAQLALSYMELSGIKLDIETVMKIRSEYIARVSQLETSLRGRAKALGMTQFDIKKPKQKIKLLKLSGINVDSSSKTVLEGRKEPVAVEMMEVSSKLSFLSGILNYASDAMGQGGVLRTNFSCTDLLTGQLTSYDPPVLNIPKDPIRRMVVSRFGSSGSILELDYSQLHLRIMGNVSKCKGFIDAFLSGKDLHARTGAQAVLGIPEEEFLDRLTRNDKVCANARQLGKRINFSVITEITAKGLAELAGIPVRNAETILGRFFEANPEIKKTQENQHAFARRHSYVISPTGRVRHLPYFTSDDKAVRAKAERQATDYLISNPGRFTTLIAMVAMVEALNTANMQSRVINQIHDALVFDVLHSEFDEVVRLARVHCICLPHSLIPEIYNPIKLVMDGKHGRTWYYGKEHERLTLS